MFLRSLLERCSPSGLRVKACSSPISLAENSAPAGDAPLGPRWARFLPDEKSGKESPKAGPSPALWNPPRGTGSPCVLLFSALGPVGSHGWRGDSTEHTCFSAKLCFSHQGLTLVSCCFQRSAAWFPAAGTPLLQGRPGCENHLAVGPASQGDLVWWQKQEPQ